MHLKPSFSRHYHSFAFAPSLCPLRDSALEGSEKSKVDTRRTRQGFYRENEKINKKFEIIKIICQDRQISSARKKRSSLLRSVQT